MRKIRATEENPACDFGDGGKVAEILASATCSRTGAPIAQSSAVRELGRRLAIYPCRMESSRRAGNLGKVSNLRKVAGFGGECESDRLTAHRYVGPGLAGVWTALLLLALFAALLTGCNGGGADATLAQTDAENPAQKIKAAVVKRGDISEAITVTGTLLAKHRSKISPQVSGKIHKIYVDVGDEVTAGRKLVELEQLDFEIDVQRSMARLNTARANLKKRLAGARDEEVEIKRALVQLAKAEYERAKLEYDRMNNLLEKESIPQKRYDDASARYKAAKASLDKTQQELYIAERGPTKEDVAVAEALVKEAEAQLRASQKRLADSTITAPYDGFIVEKLMDAGETVSTNPPSKILEIVDTSTLELEAGVPAVLFARIEVGNPVEINIEGLDRTIPASVSAVSQKVDVENRSFKVKVAIENGDHLLKSGLFATARIVYRESKNALLVPRVALRSGGSSRHAAVFVLENKVVERRPVKVGIVNDDFAEATSGLKEKELVVISNLNRLKDGARIAEVEISSDGE